MNKRRPPRGASSSWLPTRRKSLAQTAQHCHPGRSHAHFASRVLCGRVTQSKDPSCDASRQTEERSLPRRQAGLDYAGAAQTPCEKQERRRAPLGMTTRRRMVRRCQVRLPGTACCAPTENRKAPASQNVWAQPRNCVARREDHHQRTRPAITEPMLAVCAFVMPKNERGLMRMNSTRKRARPVSSR
jgi:hypothetical protein